MASAGYGIVRRAQWIFAATIFGSGCVAIDEDRGFDVATVDARPIDAPYGGDLTAAAAVEAGDICDSLPAEGPCALACDVDALAEQYVPAGACAAFSCTLTDGREIAVHACHVGD